MLSSILVSALAAASAVQAAPFFGNSPIVKRAEEASTPYNAAYDKALHTISDVQIHESCNASQTHFLRRGLDEMKTLAIHAHDRILSKGEEDPLYIQYFGNASSASTSGYYAQIAYGNKPGVLLRCDDADGNCATQTTSQGPWAGHHRGKNASLETVICDPTYHVRMPLSGLCWDPAAQIGDIPITRWLATDLLHRMTHIPSITYGNVIHAADSYHDILALAARNGSEAAYNSDGFQYYALDAYARDVAFPPNGCVSPTAHLEKEDTSHGAASSSVVSSAAATSTVAPSATAVGVATTTSSAAESCHTHADGVIHCGDH